MVIEKDPFRRRPILFVIEVTILFVIEVTILFVIEVTILFVIEVCSFNVSNLNVYPSKKLCCFNDAASRGNSLCDTWSTNTTHPATPYS